jgi:hypothetical protein
METDTPPIVFGYIKDGTDAQIEARMNAIAELAREQRWVLKETYVEPDPGKSRKFSELLGAARLYAASGNAVHGVIVSQEDDLNVIRSAQVRRQLTDLGLRIEHF